MVYPEPYRIEERPPTVSELRTLNQAVDWGDLPEDDDAVARGLAASLFGVVVTVAGQTVACGRLVGDGGVYFYVQDVIVIPEHQRQGVGDLVMAEVWGHLREHAPKGATIGLMAAVDRAGFYERWGFAARPAEGPGMVLAWDPEHPPALPSWMTGGAGSTGGALRRTTE
jgi:GNAT superfamily N-acetyltransferase